MQTQNTIHKKIACFARLYRRAHKRIVHTLLNLTQCCLCSSDILIENAPRNLIDLFSIGKHAKRSIPKDGIVPEGNYFPSGPLVWSGKIKRRKIC